MLEQACGAEAGAHDACVWDLSPHPSALGGALLGRRWEREASAYAFQRQRVERGELDILRRSSVQPVG